jgi:hypothetical protein
MRVAGSGAAGYLLATSVFALAGAARAGETTTYAYDALGRLIATTSSGTVNNGLTAQLGYDPAGNRSTYTVAGAGAGAGGTPVIADGSFEQPPQNGGYTYNPVVADTQFVGNAGVEANGSAWDLAAAPDGGQAAFLQGSQAITSAIRLTASGLTVGGWYTLSFYAAQRAGFAPNPVIVRAGSVALGTYVAPSTAFTLFTTPAFQATAAAMTIELSAASSDPYLATGLDKVTLASAAAPAPTVADASFEQPSQNGGYTYNPTVSGATFAGNSGVTSQGGAWEFVAAPDGTQMAFLQGSASATSAIQLAATGLAAGSAYTLSFQLARRTSFSPNPVEVRVGGALLGTFTPASTAFTAFATPAFQAAGATTTIEFRASSGDPYLVAGLDKVALAAAGGTPPPPPPPPPPPGNQPPVAVADSGSTNKCTAASFNVLANDYDPDGNAPLTLASVTYSAPAGEASVSGNAVYFAPSGVTGTARIDYVVRDTLGATAGGTLTLSIVSGPCGNF